MRPRPETTSERRDRQNAQIIIKWWMLVPGFRALIILMSQGNPDQALKYKTIPELQIEKNQTYRAFAVMGQLNLVSATIPCAVIGTMMMDWSNPTADIAQLVFSGMAFCSATLSISTMCFGVIDGLVNTIDTMDRALSDYRSQQKLMRDNITYAKQHFDDITTLSDDVRLLLARLRKLPDFDVAINTRIGDSLPVEAIAACRASINSFVCEDANQLELVTQARKYIETWVKHGHKMVLNSEAYWTFEMLKGDLMKWSMKYATELARALDNVDNMNLDDLEFVRVKQMLDEKKTRWADVAKLSTEIFLTYELDKAYKNITTTASTVAARRNGNVMTTSNSNMVVKRFVSYKEQPWGAHINFDHHFSNWTITKVEEDSQFSKKGVKIGWRVQQVNDIAISAERKHLIRQILEDGEACTIYFETYDDVELCLGDHAADARGWNQDQKRLPAFGDSEYETLPVGDDDEKEDEAQDKPEDPINHRFPVQSQPRNLPQDEDQGGADMGGSNQSRYRALVVETGNE